MAHIPSIVEGEASESDDEYDVVSEVKGSFKKNDPDLPHGVVIAGEASESEEEDIQSEQIKREPQAEILSPPSMPPQKETPYNTDSLLMKKLVESNLSLRNNVMDLLKTTIQNSLDQLTESEKLLVNSQVRVQRANGSIKTFSSNSTLLVNKLSQSSTYLPYIHIPEEDNQGQHTS